MSLFESAAAALVARAHRDSDALLALSCAPTRQRIVVLRDSLGAGELWQWQQEESASEGYDDTQAVIEQLFSQPPSQVSKMLSPATFQLVEGAIRRARLRFAMRKRPVAGQLGAAASLAYAYYVVMEREPDGIWRYFNTTIERCDTGGDHADQHGVVRSSASGLWFPSIGMAEDAARHGGQPVGADASSAEGIDSGYGRVGPCHYGKDADDDDDDDDSSYWAMYDSSTPAKASMPAQVNNNAEDDYWSRYDAIDAQTPPPRKNKPKPAVANGHRKQDNGGHASSRQLTSIGEPRDVLQQNLRVLRHMAHQMGISREEFVEMARQA